MFGESSFYKDGKFEAETKSWEFLGALFHLLKPELLQLLSQLHLADLSHQTLFFCHCLLFHIIFFCFICSPHTGLYTYYVQGICQVSFCKTNILNASHLSQSIFFIFYPFPVTFNWTASFQFWPQHWFNSCPLGLLGLYCPQTLFKTAHLVS